MNTNLPNALHIPLLVVGIAVFLAGIAGAVSAPGLGWSRSASAGEAAVITEEQADETQPPVRAGARTARARERCDECGVIASMRRLAAVGSAPALFEITVRLSDSSTRVLSDASPALWRPGEPAILIDGWSPPDKPN